MLHCNVCCRAEHRLLWCCRAVQDLQSLHPMLQGHAQLASGVAAPCATCKQCRRAVQSVHPLLLGHAGPATCAAAPCKVWSLCCRPTHCSAPAVAGPHTTCKQRCSTMQSLHPMLPGYARFASGAAGLCRTCNQFCRTLQNWHPMLQGHAWLASGAAVQCGMDKQCLQGHAGFAPCAAEPCRICIWCFRICTQHCRVAQGLHPESQDLHLVLQGHEGFAAMLQHAPCRPCTQHHTGPTALPQPCGPLLAPWGPPAPSTSPSTPQRRRLARCALASTLHRAAGGGGGTVGPGVSWPPPCAQDPPFHSYRKRRQRGPPVP